MSVDVLDGGTVVGVGHVIQGCEDRQSETLSQGSSVSPAPSIRQVKIPTPSIRASKTPLEVGLHWLSGSLGVGHIPYISGVLERAFGVAPVEGLRIKGYNSCLRFGEHVGLFFSYEPTTDTFLREDAFLSLPGQACEQLRESDWGALWAGLDLCLFKATRIDVGANDFDKPITPEEIHQRYVVPERYGPFRVANSLLSNDGSGNYFGKRGRWGNGCQFVIYDKNAETAGKVDALRYEVRFYGDKAERAFCQIGGSFLDTFDARRLGPLIGGAIEFYDSDQRHADRREVAPWWGDVQARLGKAKIQLPKQDLKSIEELEITTAKQCRNRLGVIRQWYVNQDREDDFDRWVDRECRLGWEAAPEAMKALAGSPSSELMDEELPF